MIDTSQKFKLIILLNLAVFLIGTIANTYFALIAIGYILSMLLLYYLGSKINDVFLNVGYIWISKWTAFVVFLVLAGTFQPDTFLYALSMFLVFNLSVNPADVMAKNEAHN